uniref:uncharacterized protein C20orf96 homolog isoform X1 n=3 Tax=Jaculus jaculus TaxID=51337 RepID=UPI001E1B1EE8|nr:uncharacterized protein C20orf96 homolog isoform X1 [Jaculus jaculus]
MAQVFLKGRHSGIHSAVYKFQWSEPKMKPSILPPLHQGTGHNKSKVKILSRIQSGIQNQATTAMKSPRGLRKKEQLHMGKMQAKVRLMRSMLRNQRTSLQDLLNHESFLSKLNQELIKTIEDMEESTGRNARAMLQQQGVLGNVIDILEYSNKKRVQQLRSELQQWEEKEEYKINGLQRQVDQMNAEIHQAHEEVGFLSTYMDHEYPVRSVRIASHKRQLQQAKDSQQDELDNLYEMRRSVLEYISNSIHQKKKSILRALMVKTQQPHEEMLLMKTRGSQQVRRCMVWFRELIEELNKEIPVLADEVERLQTELWEPRQIAFEDVLLHRPRCNPDMPVILRIPVEEQLPF